MPLIQPPPPAPKMVTITVRMKQDDLCCLQAYEAYSSSPTHSYVIAGSLERLYEQDTGFTAWRDAHPNFATDKKTRRNGSPKRPTKAAASGAALSSAVAAADAASITSRAEV
jgi:hypothetical protein